MFTLQKRARRTTAKMQWRESWRPRFKSLKLLTLTCLYNIGDVSFVKTKSDLILRESEIHSYETRGSDNYQTERHWTMVQYMRVCPFIGIHFVKKLPKSIERAAIPKAFQIRCRARCARNLQFAREPCWFPERVTVQMVHNNIGDPDWPTVLARAE